MVPFEPRTLINEQALSMMATALHGQGSQWSPWLPAALVQFLQPAIRNPFHDVQVTVWGIRALQAMLTHACDSRHQDRHGCVIDSVVDIVSNLARLRCSLSDFHRKLGYVARTQQLSSLLPLSGDYASVSSTVDCAIYSIVSLFHYSSPPVAPLLPQHATERRQQALNIHDSHRVQNSGKVLELHELPASFLGDFKIRDANNVQISVPRAVLLWEDELGGFERTQSNLKAAQCRLGDASLQGTNHGAADARLTALLHREAQLYVERQELLRRQPAQGAPLSAPWDQLPGQVMHNEKDALQHRYGAYDPLRSQKTQTAQLSDAHDDLDLRRKHAKQLLERLKKQLQ